MWRLTEHSVIWDTLPPAPNQKAQTPGKQAGERAVHAHLLVLWNCASNSPSNRLSP
jgi:hypothetical protein